MPLFFSNFHRLDDLCVVDVKGVFDPNWTKSYIQIQQGVKKVVNYIKPCGLGSGLLLKPLKLRHNSVDGDLTSLALNDISSSFNLNQLIYVIVSSRFPILYVGISEGGLVKGILKDGRLRHHIHKMLAIRESSTSHTQGWLEHAKERYEANLIAYANKESDQQFNNSLMSDVYIAIGNCGHDNWSAKNVEGTVLEGFKLQLNRPQRLIQVMNSGGVKYDPIAINFPGNINQF